MMTAILMIMVIITTITEEEEDNGHRGNGNNDDIIIMRTMTRAMKRKCNQENADQDKGKTTVRTLWAVL